MPMVTSPSPGETYVPPANDTFEIRQGLPPDDALEARLEFVRAMKWLAEEDDSDRYDGIPETYHFTKRTGEEVLATMRLTRVANIQESLSYGMLADNEAFQAAVAARQDAVSDGQLWDFTRLCFPTDGSQSSATIESGMVELFGMGEYISKSQATEDEKIYWIFTTTPWMMRFFDDHGIECEQLGRGRLANADGTPETTLFCKVDVRDAVEKLASDQDHQATYEALQRGVKEAQAAYVYA